MIYFKYEIYFKVLRNRFTNKSRSLNHQTLTRNYNGKNTIFAKSSLIANDYSFSRTQTHARKQMDAHQLSEESTFNRSLNACSCTLKVTTKLARVRTLMKPACCPEFALHLPHRQCQHSHLKAPIPELLSGKCNVSQCLMHTYSCLSPSSCSPARP